MAFNNVSASGSMDRYVDVLPTEGDKTLDDEIFVKDPESGAFERIDKKTVLPAPQPLKKAVTIFEWKPVYWTYVAVGALVLYTLFKK